MKHTPVREILCLFIVTRLLLLFITYTMYILLTAENYTSTPVDTVALFASWHHGDAVNYTRIAQYGYQSVSDLTFFPLFPFLIACISHVLGSWSYLLVGTVVSNVALFGALWVIYQLAWKIVGTGLAPVRKRTAGLSLSARSASPTISWTGTSPVPTSEFVGANGLDLFPGNTVAHRTLLYLCIFPTAFFFFAAYDQSLYLLLAAGTFLALEHERWWLAGLLGLLAALTRSVGLLLVVPYLYELFSVPSNGSRKAIDSCHLPIGEVYTPNSNESSGNALWLRRERTLAHTPAILKSLLPCMLIPLGTAIYALYCWRTFGNPLAFVGVQLHWDSQTIWPQADILHQLGALFWHPLQPLGSARQATIILNLSATAGLICLIIAGWHKLPKSYSIWMSLCLLFMLASPASIQTDVSLSNLRSVLELFPAFITLALLTENRPRTHYASIFIFTTLLAILSTSFITNRGII